MFQFSTVSFSPKTETHPVSIPISGNANPVRILQESGFRSVLKDWAKQYGIIYILTCLEDILPTLMELTDLTIPEYVDGINLVPLLHVNHSLSVNGFTMNTPLYKGSKDIPYLD